MKISIAKILKFLHCVGLQNYKLKWKGPYARTDKANRYPDKLKEDTLRVSKIGCDVVVFLVFNDFSSGQDVAGHKYSGFAGMFTKYQNTGCPNQICHFYRPHHPNLEF